MEHHDRRCAANAAMTEPLARAIARRVDRPGDHETALPNLSLHRRDAPRDPVPCIYPVSLALTAQGDKRVLVGDKIYEYFPGQSVVTSIEVPVVSRVTRASATEPYLGLRLRFDPRTVAAAAAQMNLPASNGHGEAISIETVDPAMVDGLVRLVNLLDDPDLLPRIAPLVEQEIIIRLLNGPHGAHLRQLTMGESPNQQIREVVAWLQQNFVKAVRMNKLAAKANMSLSAFRQHFRDVTGMSPLQYQKRLRLQEARELMLHQEMDVRRAAASVGYASASQFSREYSRCFGAPPNRDVRRMQSS
jgi:AraC-like DNA-binding protein